MVHELMIEFAELTGLSPVRFPPVRYLWTDAFAVCNFIGLHRRTGDRHYRHLALLLIDQVHGTLGRHRQDDPRTGWISGVDEKEGWQHPTAGGLRIGKELNERRSQEPFDELLEWDRDGQYYHYLTQWMHALDCASRLTGNPVYTRWAVELAKTAHARFTHVPAGGGKKRLYWKMSIDLTYPLVSSMGHHDPLEGLIAYSELQETAGRYAWRSPQPDLMTEINDMGTIGEEKSWTTDDPLGIGGLLSGAYRMAQLIVTGHFARPGLLETVLDDSLTGLDYFVKGSPLKMPPQHRLAFRELGLSIGLQAVERLLGLVERSPDIFSKKALVHSQLRGLMQHVPLSTAINEFWLVGKNRQSPIWREHRYINMVMLATSLAPDGYLLLQ